MAFDWQTVTTLVSPFLALFGAGVSVYTLYVQRRDKRTHLRVTVTEDVIATTKMQGAFLLGAPMNRDDAGRPVGVGEPVACLELANLGEKTVRVVAVRMVEPSGAYMRVTTLGAEGPFPPVIEPGDSTRCWIGLGTVTDIVRTRGTTGEVRLTFEVTDALGHVHKGKMVVNTDEWLPYSDFFSEQAVQTTERPDAAYTGEP